MGFPTKFRGQGFKGVVPVGTTHDIDYLFDKTYLLNGVDVFFRNWSYGDTVDFLIVDVDGILGEAGAVLDTFAKDWNVDDATKVKINYTAKIPAGVYVRVRYNSTGNTSNPEVYCNLFRHELVTS